MAVDPRADEHRQIEHVTQDLMREFAGLPQALVAAQVSEVERRFTQAPVRSFVPVLVRRGARERLCRLR